VGDAPPAAEAAPAPAPAPAAAVAPGPASTAPAPGTAEPAAAPKPQAERAFNRSADGIDDDNPLPTDPQSPALIAFNGASLKMAANPAAAVQEFVDAAKKTTYFYAAYFNAGVAAERAGDKASAERYYLESLKLKPDYGPALSNLFLLHWYQGRKDAANNVVDSALAQHADKAGPHLAAAMRGYVKSDVSEVEREALAAVRIDERSVPAMRLRAWVFYQQGRSETARFALENALKLEPGNALLHLQLGHVLVKLDEEEKALREFGIAANLRPELVEAQSHYGNLALKRGDAENGAAALKKAVDLRPDSATAWMHYGNGLRAQKKYKEANEAYAKALTLDPNLHAVHFNVGIMYLDNEIPDVDYLARLEKAQAELIAYEGKVQASKEMRTRLDSYQKTLTKLITREKKKRERDAERKALEEEEKKKASEANAPADGAAPAPAGDK